MPCTETWSPSAFTSKREDCSWAIHLLSCSEFSALKVTLSRPFLSSKWPFERSRLYSDRLNWTVGRETSVQKQRTMRRNCACYVVPSTTSYKQTNTFTHKTELQFQRFHKARSSAQCCIHGCTWSTCFLHTLIYTSTNCESNPPQTIQHAHTCMQACTHPPTTTTPTLCRAALVNPAPPRMHYIQVMNSNATTQCQYRYYYAWWQKKGILEVSNTYFVAINFPLHWNRAIVLWFERCERAILQTEYRRHHQLAIGFHVPRYKRLSSFVPCNGSS